MTGNRRFLYEILGSGLELGTVNPEDVLKHVTPEILAHHLPVSVKAKLLEASLAAEKMTAGLVVETVGVEALAEHSPIPALWACLTECARRQMAGDEDLSSPGLPISSELGGELKPNRTARPSTVRMPGRISALSPRSRAAAVVRSTGRPETDEGVFNEAETRIKSEPDFDLAGDDEPSEVRSEPKPDDLTRPGELPLPRKN